MAYSDDITALNPDHLYTFDGNSNDSVGSANGSNTTISFTNAAIARDATNCATTTALTSRIDIPSTTDINGSLSQKTVAGWYQTTALQTSLVGIYREGGDGVSTPLWQLVLCLGNTLMYEAIDSFIVQVVGSDPLVANRTYHICATFEGSSNANEIKLYIDGVQQTIENPDPPAPGSASIGSRSQPQFGDASGYYSGIGGAQILGGLSAAVDGKYQYWATFSGSDAVLTDNEIRQTLFERGALADFTISTDTEANMQTALDAITDSQGNSPCCIEVEAVTGGGDFTLTSDKVFDSAASIHFRYNGTSDTLTIVNIDDTQMGNASIGAAPFGGSITIVDRQTLTVTVKDLDTNTAISGARVFIKADTGGPLAAGTVIMNTTTNGSGVATATFDYTSDQPIIGYVRKGSSSTYYKEQSISGPLTSTALNATVLMEVDE